MYAIVAPFIFSKGVFHHHKAHNISREYTSFPKNSFYNFPFLSSTFTYFFLFTLDTTTFTALLYYILYTTLVFLVSFLSSSRIFIKYTRKDRRGWMIFFLDERKPFAIAFSQRKQNELKKRAAVAIPLPSPSPPKQPK